MLTFISTKHKVPLRLTCHLKHKLILHVLIKHYWFQCFWTAYCTGVHAITSIFSIYWNQTYVQILQRHSKYEEYEIQKAVCHLAMCLGKLLLWSTALSKLHIVYFSSYDFTVRSLLIIEC